MLSYKYERAASDAVRFVPKTGFFGEAANLSWIERSAIITRNLVTVRGNKISLNRFLQFNDSVRRSASCMDEFGNSYQLFVRWTLRNSI